MIITGLIGAACLGLGIAVEAVFGPGQTFSGHIKDKVDEKPIDPPDA